MASKIIHDFWTVEERQRVYAESRKRRRPRPPAAPVEPDEDDTVIVYVPRVRYTARPNLASATTGITHRPHRWHEVGGFPRKAEHPNPRQIELARKAGVILPPGYTWVRGHPRGGKDQPDRKVIYKSRSISELLFGEPNPAAGKKKKKRAA